MLFATNRTPKGSSRTKVGRKISFDSNNTQAAQHMYFCERINKDEYVEIGSDKFFSQLKNLANKNTQILLYVHGFNNTIEGAVFPHAEKLQQKINAQAGEELVHVVPLIWPCEDGSPAAIIKDYWDDQKAADASGVAFSRMLGKFDDWKNKLARGDEYCYRRINMIAHSMGNRVLCNAVRIWAEDDMGGEVPLLFRNLFMASADVKNEALRDDRIGGYLPHMARNLVVYYAADDLAMSASKAANLKHRRSSRRLGMTGPEKIDALPKNVYEVDCASFNNTYDHPVGHGYFTADQVIGHMTKAIKGARVDPNQRSCELPK